VLAASPGLESPPQDARIVLRKGRPQVVPDVPGVTLDADALAAAARTALLDPARTATVRTVLRRPALTTEKARALGVKERVSTFSTVYPANADRTTNLRIAARTVNGTLVLPGKTFSLNDVLGRRTPEKGYRAAPVIEGTRLVKDYGGGVSQIATTIFNNVFFAGLEDVRHQPHSFYISRYPEGREATVSFPTVDLVWRNDSPYAVLIEASVTKTVNVSFWSTKVWDIKAEKGPRTNYRPTKRIYDPKPSCVPQGAVAGFDVVVRRLFYKGSTLVRTQTFSTSYAPEDEVICAPEPGTGDRPESADERG
jgi:vancomycin resistance protein YoaR